MANLAKYRYTTGPISISEFINNIRILVLNNGAKRHNARVRIFNLDPKPKKRYSMKPLRLPPIPKSKRNLSPCLMHLKCKF
jgi:hypothetical protein